MVIIIHKNVVFCSFFEKIILIEFSPGVLRSNGSIQGCFNTYVDEFLIADELRGCLLDPSHLAYDSFSEEDRREFIFRLFQSLCLGGRLCQYEDEIAPYLDVTKKMYKDLIT